MRNQVLGIVALGIAIAVLPAASFAKGGGGGGGGGGAQHFSSTGGATVKNPGSPSGTKTTGHKTVSKKYARPCGGQRAGGGHGPTHSNPACNGGSGGITASAPPNCKAGGEGCQHQH
jgi:hypothetical protein